MGYLIVLCLALLGISSYQFRMIQILSSECRASKNLYKGCAAQVEILILINQDLEQKINELKNEQAND